MAVFQVSLLYHWVWPFVGPIYSSLLWMKILICCFSSCSHNSYKLPSLSQCPFHCWLFLLSFIIWFPFFLNFHENTTLSLLFSVFLLKKMIFWSFSVFWTLRFLSLIISILVFFCF
jgi:hypothetical protein